MTWLRVFVLRFSGMFRKRRKDVQLEEELQSHFEMLVDENLQRGMPNQEARRAAELALGGAEQIKEAVRDQRGLPLIESLWQDIRFALRMLRKNPGFTVVAILTLALGIGANTAIFGVVNGVLLQPLPYPDAGRIVALSTEWKQKGHMTPRLTGGDFLDIQSQNQVFDAVGLYVGGEIGVQIGNRGEFGGVYAVNPDFLRVFSVAPAYGRLLEPGDEDRAALVSFSFATRMFGGAAAALGQSISVESQAYQIAGVLPRTFDFPSRADVWFAAPAHLWNLNRNSYNYRAVAKLRTIVTLKQAQTRLDTVAARLADAFPDDNDGKSFLITPLRDQLVAPVETTLWLLMAAVSVILLISCSNVANLLLARAAFRSREIALRTALGASPWRILRQLLVEGAVLAALAALLGLILAVFGTEALVRFAPENLPRLHDVRVDRFVFMFTGAVSLLTTVALGLLPASRIDLQEALRSGGSHALACRSSARLRSALVVAEVSLSLVLGVGAILLFRSFVALSTVDLGYHTEGRLVMYAHIPAHGRDEYLHVAASFDRLLPEFATIPGVQSVAAAMGVPMGRYGSNGSYFVERVPTQNAPNAGFALTSPAYFATMGVPLLRGREFTTGDRYDAAFVAIINEKLAERSFPNEDPINKRIKCGLDAPDRWMTIVGVVGNTRQNSPDFEPEPELYMPLSQHPYHANEFQVVLRTTLPPASLVRAVRGRMQDLNPTAATSFTTLDQMVAASVATPRFRLLLTSVFAILAILLAMVGLYGVMSYLTAQRSAEIGVRMALGAQPKDVMRMVLGQGLKLALLGAWIGIGAALGLTRLMTGMLFGVTAHDPVTFGSVALLLVAVALLACYLPARRATRVDPMVALRYE